MAVTFGCRCEEMQALVKNSPYGREGLVCPALTRRQIERGLWSGRLRFDPDLGLEQRCAKCRDYYPLDTEFFYFRSSSSIGTLSYCKACHREASGTLAKGRSCN